jgi:prophage tail gpP-like protein/phage tail protein X
MSTYRVIAGDTFESIARKKYGTEKEADSINRANPGVSKPLTAGTVLTVPTLPDSPQDTLSRAPAATDDEVAILIDGQRFRFWNRVRVTRSIDTMDTVEFGAPFDADAPGFRETFRPFSFKPVVITVGGTPLFTGTMVAVSPAVENSQKIVSVSGYSLPGVLNDCTSPASTYPLEFNNQGLRDISAALASPFGIAVEFQADQGAIFERVASEPGKKVLAFLTELAKQRNLIISSTTRGKLLFSQSIETGTPVARLQQGGAPVMAVTPFFSPQEYYSHITGIEPVIVGLAGSQFTVKNPRLQGVTRPITFNAPDTLDADVKGAVEAKAGRMFGNMASYSVRVATWRDPQGNLWEPNTIVKLQAPEAMIYNEYAFVIRSVEFEREGRKETATLNLVIPGSFSGKVPESLPWEG